MTIGMPGQSILDKMTLDIAIVLGIRPDLVRAAPLLNILKNQTILTFKFIWSGQHYSQNLKDDFLSELNIPEPDYELNVDVNNDITFVSTGILDLANILAEIKPRIAIFLGDTNTVLLSVAASILNIPIFHIESCMRSFDLEMPEERNRRLIDHISTRLYAYLPRYRDLGVEEGLSNSGIVVTGNLAVDAIEYFMSLPTWENYLEKGRSWRSDIGVSSDYLMLTAHRRENINHIQSLTKIMELAARQDYLVLFPANYATQRKLREYEIKLSDNILMCDPIEYGRFLPSLFESRGVLTDSGTVVEEAAILNIPSVQMRRSTERPEVYEIGASIKFNPHADFEFVKPEPKLWKHNLGDGKASVRIFNDLTVWLNKSQPFDIRVGSIASTNIAWGFDSKGNS